MSFQDMSMEAALKSALHTDTLTRVDVTPATVGMICTGHAYNTQNGMVFVKIYNQPLGRCMFEGEAASLKTLLDTGILRAPKPIKVIDNPEGGALLVMEYLDMKPLTTSSAASKLGEQMARLHMLNASRQTSSLNQDTAPTPSDSLSYVSQFGYHTSACYGRFQVDNTWQDDWVTFFTKQRMQFHFDHLMKNEGDTEVMALWQQLLPRIPSIFSSVEVKPALLHGDLWMNNVGEIQGEPVVFDPTCYYGHRELEVAYWMMGSFPPAFLESYLQMLPLEEGFEKRKPLYDIYFSLNEWNHFGLKKYPYLRKAVLSSFKKLLM